MRRSKLWRCWPLLPAVVAIALNAMAPLPARNGDRAPSLGPDIVILRELENVYEPVPFDHLTHAKMAEMWHGCETCHHRSPQPVTSIDGETTAAATLARTQDASAEIPACKSCHPVDAADTDIHMPGLKGAYHRQCLNCHKEWMHENACVICHLPKSDGRILETDPTPGDIVGRMHPPIPEPEDVHYKTRFTPADGGNVLFRHKGHTVDFGLRCVDCHFEDNCANCHSPTGALTAQKPLRPGMTWEESHGPCMACHVEDRCVHCHYKDDQEPPPAFTHVSTGQELDADHANLGCTACHAGFTFAAAPTCGEAACHPDRVIEFPTDLPGPVRVPEPAPGAVEAATPEEPAPVVWRPGR